MSLSWIDKVRALSFEHMYMLEDWPDPLPPAPPHFVWQAPFVFAPHDASLDDLTARMRRAGELWLVNRDMRPHQELIIAHVERPWFSAFVRAVCPDEAHLLIGPIPRRVLRPSEATPLLHVPLVFRESPQSHSRELWRELGE